MARYRSRPVNPYLQKLMNERGWKTLKEASDATGIPMHTLTSLADVSPEHHVLQCHVNAAEKFGVNIEQWILGLLATA